MSNAASALAAAVASLDRSQWLPMDEIAAVQRKKLVQLATHCEKYSAHFRRRLRDAGLAPADLGEPDGLGKLPLLSRRALQSVPDVFCTAVPRHHIPLSETRTSGSTGEPVAVKRTAISSLDWLATTMREHVWHHRDFNGRFCAIRATIMTLSRFDNWGPPASLLRQTGPALGVPITTPIREQIALIAEFQPDILLIYPNILSAFTQHAETSGIRFPKLRQILSVGETLSPELRAHAIAAFGVEVSDIYSSQEVGNIALQCPQSSLYHVMAENLIVEVVDEKGDQVPSGKTGRIVVTDLHNFATPLIRYDIGDYAEVGLACSCGRGLPTLAHILGRERNLILMPDGSRHWPLVGYAKYREIAPVRQYQVVQEGRQQVEMRLVVERPLTSHEEENLIAHVQASLRYPFAIRLSYFENKIPADATGKFEEFVCRVR